MERRDVLRLLGGIGVVALAGCATSSKRGARTTTTSAPVDASGPSTAAIPEETAGPFPGDGSNGPDVLTQRGVVRRDITKSFGSASGTAEGVPTTLQLTVLAAGTGKPLTDAAVYVWHCDREGRYSLLRRRHRPELSARRADDRRVRCRDLRHDLPRVLPGTLAAHPLRGVP